MLQLHVICKGCIQNTKDRESKKLNLAWDWERNCENKEKHLAEKYISWGEIMFEVMQVWPAETRKANSAEVLQHKTGSKVNTTDKTIPQ